MPIQIICAWCRKEMEKKGGDAPYPISHSICPDCKQKIRAEIENNLKSDDSETKTN